MAALRTDTMNPAERFEDEKRRIIDSCFSKREEDGSVSESYITHIRVKEDAEYPSSPPPPDSPAVNKKDRVIVVAVRRAGRVRMHKARENGNGTFSIGKTWMLDHLSAIESFTGVQPRSTDEASRKMWAGDTGMLITIQKPYFWKATSSKEKDFFITSLVKIHRKYAGRDPQLSGFTPQEMAAFAGPNPRQQPRQGPLPGQSRGSGPSPGPIPPNGGMMAQRPGPEPSMSMGRERLPSTGSGGSHRPNFGRRDMAPGFSDEQDQRHRFEPVRVGSPAASTVSDMSFAGRPAPSTISDTSYGVSTLFSDRDRRQESLNSFDSFQPRSPLPPGRNSSERLPLTGATVAVGGGSGAVGGATATSRYGSPGGPQPPSLNPRSPDRRGPPDMMSALSDTGTSPMPGSPASRLDNLSADRRRPPAASTQTSFGQSSQGGLEESTLRDDLRTKNGSSVSHVSAGSQSEISRPSTAGLQGSPQRPPALNISTEPRRSDFLKTSQPSVAPISASTTNSGPLAGSDTQPVSQNAVNHVQATPDVYAQPMQREPSEEQRSKEKNIPPPVQTVSDIASKLALLSPTDSASPSTPTTPEENYRPGLGPMIKKRQDVANRLRKAATAAAAFKPRPGGAGDLALKSLDKQNDSGDGITGVFVPPLKSPLPQANPMSFENVTDQPKSPITMTNVSSPPVTPGRTAAPEEHRVEPAAPKTVLPPADSVRTEAINVSPPKPDGKNTEESKPKQLNAEELRKKQISAHATKYAKALGVNPILLEGRTADIEAIFDDIGWAEGKPLKRTFDDLQAEIKRELSRVETGSWLDAFEGTDDRVVAVSTMLDKTIAECEELDGLLTLYNVELGTLNDDIQFIENQSHGLQVQTANQRQLALELQNLLKTISIPPSKLAALQDSSLSKPDSLAAAEDALNELYKALVTIDPNMARSEDSTRAEQRDIDGMLGGGIGNMQAVQDKRATYIREANDFILRLRHQLESKYKEAEAQVQNALGRSRNSLPDSIKLDVDAWDNGRKVLWMYSPIMLFARNVVPSEWEELITMYGNTIKPTYRAELRKSIDGWKVVARKSTGQEQDALFTTSQEKEVEGGMARKLTVKRSKTLREGPKVGIGDRNQQQGKIPAYQAFYSALLEICKAIFIEQNFIVKLFHATSTDTSEFSDLIKAAHPQDRQGIDNLTDSGPPDFGGPYGPRIKQQIANIFYTFNTDLQGLIDLIVDQNPLNIAGVMFAIEDNLDKVQHTNQDFLSENLNRAHDDLERKYIRFIDEQMSAIDATKVKISKRKGVIPFMKVFPLFAGVLEDMLPSPSADASEIRGRVNSDYQKIYRAMSKALIEVGNKDQDANAGDDEKEQLNHHILLIENHNHYIEEVDVRNNPILLQGREDSESTMNQHMEQYVNSVIQRPLGPLLSHIEQLEAGVETAIADGKTASSIATQASYRPAPFRKTIGAFDAKEIRKGVDLLRKRVEKHFGDADDERISSRLVEKVTRECEQRYYDILERTQTIARDVYESQVEIELRKEDIAAAFQR